MAEGKKAFSMESVDYLCHENCCLLITDNRGESFEKILGHNREILHLNFDYDNISQIFQKSITYIEDINPTHILFHCGLYDLLKEEKNNFELLTYIGHEIQDGIILKIQRGLLHLRTRFPYIEISFSTIPTI